jgi:hypothetical protein
MRPSDVSFLSRSVSTRANMATGISERRGGSQRAILAGFRRELDAKRPPKREIPPLMRTALYSVTVRTLTGVERSFRIRTGLQLRLAGSNRLPIRDAGAREVTLS